MHLLCKTMAGDALCLLRIILSRYRSMKMLRRSIKGDRSVLCRDVIFLSRSHSSQSKDQQ